LPGASGRAVRECVAKVCSAVPQYLPHLCPPLTRRRERCPASRPCRTREISSSITSQSLSLPQLVVANVLWTPPHPRGQLATLACRAGAGFSCAAAAAHARGGPWKSERCRAPGTRDNCLLTEGALVWAAQNAQWESKIRSTWMSSWAC
jgi:hypothetical protein